MNKYVLITGASSGIGFELAKIFAQNGNNIFLVARSEVALQENAKLLEERYAIKTQVLAIDLTSQNAVQQLLNKLKEKEMLVTHLINNAGFGLHGNFVNIEKDQQLKMIELNIKVLVELSHSIAPLMITNGYGKILNVASVAAFMPGPYMSIYYATKSFVLSFSEALREELLPHNISVSVLCPGPTESNFWQATGMDDSTLKKLPWIMSSKEVAQYTFDQLNKNRAIIIPGFINQISSILPRLVPKIVTRKLLALMQKGQ